MSNDTGTMNLTRALFDAQKSIAAVGRDARNEHHRFNYTSAESMIAECRGVLHEHGLLLTATNTAVGPDTMNPPIVHITLQLVHIESGEAVDFTIELPYVEGKGRPADKAACGSMSTAIKYFLRGLLMLPMVDESEICGRDDHDFVADAKATAEQIALVEALIAAEDDPEHAMQVCLEWAGVSDITKISSDKANTVITAKGATVNA